MRSLVWLGVIVGLGSGCAASTVSSSDDSAADLTKAAALTLSPAGDPGLHIAMSLVHKTDPTIGSENVAVLLTRGSKTVTIPCSALESDSAGGDTLNCDLQRGYDEQDVHEGFSMQIAHDVVAGSDVYTLTQASHQQEGTEWIPMIETLFPTWKSATFKPEPLTVVSKGDASKDPFALAAKINAAFVAASAGIMVPNEASRINTAQGVKAPSGGPFATTEPGYALWGDYSMTFGFTIAKNVWWESSDPISPFVTAGDSTSGLVSTTELRARIDAVVAK